MTITRVQGNQINSASGSVTTQVVTLSAGLTLGNLVVAALSSGNNTVLFTPPDGSWTQAVFNQPAGTNANEVVLYYLIVDSGHVGQTSWTWTLNGSHSAFICLEEWHSSTGWPASPLDKTATGDTAGTPVTATTITSGTTATTTSASELWIAGLAYKGTAQTESSITAGWTKDLQATLTTNSTLTMLYQIAASTGAASCSYSIGTAAYWSGAVATFKPNVVASGYAATVLADTPIRYYRLGEASGTVAGDSGSQAQNGTIHPGVTLGTASLLTSDSVNTAMTFASASSGYVSLPTTGLPTGSAHWTIEAWVKMPTVPIDAGYYTIAEFGAGTSNQGAALMLNNKSFFCNTYATATAGALAVAVNGATYHVVGYYDGTSYGLYLNGVFQNSVVATPAVGSTYAYISAEGTTPSDFFNGVIDEVAIYSTSLSAARILAHYNAGIVAGTPMRRLGSGRTAIRAIQTRFSSGRIKLALPGATTTIRINPLGIAPHLIGLSHALIDQQLNLMQSAGIHWVRLDINWDSVEHVQGTWDYTSNSHDYIIAGIASRGMQTIGMLSQYYAPAWYLGANPTNQPPLPADYALFVQHVVTHFVGQIPYYEIGNEPNVTTFWYPAPDAAAYTALLKAGYNAVKTADSTALVISAGIAPGAGTPGDFLTAMYAAGAQGYMDAVAYHPYCYPASPDFLTYAPTFSLLATFKSIMTTNGDGAKPIMATEFGWPTSTSANGITEALQATYIRRAFQKIMHEEYQYVSIACVYDLVDDGVDPTNDEFNFGVMHTTYTQKAAYAALQAVQADYSAHFTAASYRAAVLTDTPIRYYRLGETSGTVATDIGSQAQSGTYTGGVTLGQSGLLTSDPVDPSALFDGTSGYVSLPTTNLPTGAQPWSMEAWIKMPASLPASGSWPGILSFGTRATGVQSAFLYYTTVSSLGHLTVTSPDNTIYVDYTGAVGAGVYHVVATYSGTTLTLYINGISVGTPMAGTFAIVANTARIGDDGSGANFWPGTVDEVAFYSTALTPARVTAHYNAGLSTSTSMRRLGSGRTAIRASQTRFGSGRAKIRASMTRFGSARFRLVGAHRLLTSGRASLQVGKRLLGAGRLRLVVAQRLLARGRVSINVSRRILAQGRVTLRAMQTRLASGRFALQTAFSRTQLAQGRANIRIAFTRASQGRVAIWITTHQTRLSQGRAALRAQITRVSQGRFSLQTAFGQTRKALGRLLLKVPFTRAAQGRTAIAVRRTLVGMGRAKILAAGRRIATGRLSLALRHTFASSGRTAIRAGHTLLGAGRFALILIGGRTRSAIGRYTMRASKTRFAGARFLTSVKQTRLASGRARISARITRLAAGRVALYVPRRVAAMGRMALTVASRRFGMARFKLALERTYQARARVAIAAIQRLLGIGRFRMMVRKTANSQGRAGFRVQMARQAKGRAVFQVRRSLFGGGRLALRQGVAQRRFGSGRAKIRAGAQRAAIARFLVHIVQAHASVGRFHVSAGRRTTGVGRFALVPTDFSDITVQGTSGQITVQGTAGTITVQGTSGQITVQEGE